MPCTLLWLLRSLSKQRKQISYLFMVANKMPETSSLGNSVKIPTMTCATVRFQGIKRCAYSPKKRYAMELADKMVCC